MTTDAERPAVWAVDPADPTGATRWPGREHGRFVDDAGEHVIVLFGTLRYYLTVGAEYVLPRDEEPETAP